MTKKLFHEDQYLTQCEATVTAIEGNKIQLDQTIFFAFSGGQASDAGTIGGISVEQAECIGDDISYTLTEPPSFATGDKVQVEIDGDRRKSLMRLHSAAHFVGFFFEEKTGIKELIGSNVDVHKARLDYAMNEPLGPLLPDIQEKVNALLAQEASIVTQDSPDKPGRREWICENWKCECGGTHCTSTTEVGQIKLKRKNIGSGKERIEITLQS